MDGYLRKMFILVLCAFGLGIPAVQKVNETFNQIVQPPENILLIHREAMWAQDKVKLINEQAAVIKEKVDVLREKAEVVRNKADSTVREKTYELKDKTVAIRNKADAIRDEAGVIRDKANGVIKDKAGTIRNEVEATRVKVLAWWEKAREGQWENIATRKQEKSRK